MILPLFSSLLNRSLPSLHSGLLFCFPAGKQAQGCERGTGWGTRLSLQEGDQRAPSTGKCICRVAGCSITAGTLALCQRFTWLMVPERLFWLWLDFSPGRYLASVMLCFVLTVTRQWNHLLFSPKLSFKPLSEARYIKQAQSFAWLSHHDWFWRELRYGSHRARSGSSAGTGRILCLQKAVCKVQCKFPARSWRLCSAHTAQLHNELWETFLLCRSCRAARAGCKARIYRVKNYTRLYGYIKCN